MRVFILIAGIFFLLSCTPTNLRPVSQSGSNDVVFEEDEKRLWLRSAEEQKIIEESDLIYHDQAVEEYVNKVAHSIQSEYVYSKIPFKIRIIRNHFLNAFAYPNGIVYIHTGMLSRIENEAQLATLLGHEMTHSTHRHAVKGFRGIKNTTAFLSTIQVLTVGIPGVGLVTSLLGPVGAMASVSGYSKELEEEADRTGFDLVRKAGYDLSETPKLFIHIKNELDEEGIKEPFFFGSHSKIEGRISNYNKLLTQAKEQVNSGIKNEEIYFEVMKNLIVDNAELDVKAGRLKVARRQLQKLQSKYESIGCCYLLGEIYRKIEKGKTQLQAIDFYQKVIGLDSTYANAYKGLGMIYYKEKNQELACKNFELYLQYMPNAMDKEFIKQYMTSCQGVKNE